MAHFYDKPVSATVNPQRTLVLDAREAFQYPFLLKDWTKAVFSYSVAFVMNNSDNSTTFGKTIQPVNIVSQKDRLYWGLTKYKRGKFPLDDNGYLIGHATNVNALSIGMDHHYYCECGFYCGCSVTNTNISNTGYGLSYAKTLFQGINYISASGDDAFTKRKNFVDLNFNCFVLNSGDPWYNSESSAQNYAITLIVSVEILNKGLENQQVKLMGAMLPMNKDKVSRDNKNMNAWILAQPLSIDLGTYDFHLGGIPYELPDALFLYSPFYDCKLRIHNFTAIKIS